MEFGELMQELADAVVACDGLRVANLFTEDGTYEDPVQGLFRGRTEVQRLVDEIFKSTLLDMRWDMLDPVSDGRIGYVHWVFSFTAMQPGIEGKRGVLLGVSHVELKASLISAYKELFDVGLGFTLLGAPASAYSDLYAKKTAEIAADPALARHFKP